MFNFKYLTTLLVLLLLVSCGKKIEGNERSDDDEGKPPPRVPRSTNQDVYMKGQKLYCDDNWNCPNNIAKVVVIDQKSIRYCTGVLIKKDELLTSASCLSKTFRTRNIDCRSNIFSVFPKTLIEKEKVVKCDRVIFSDKNVFENYPELWNNDVAVLKLAEPVTRSLSFMNKVGLEVGEVNIWKVDYLSDKIGVIKKDKCNILQNSYLNPFSHHKFSGMFVANGCDLVTGNTGAPMIQNGRIVGIYSKEMSNRIYNYLQGSDLLSEPISRYYHFSNVSCSRYSPFLYTRRVPKECTRSKSFSLLDKFRSSFLKNKKVHSENMLKIEEEIEVPEEFFLWDIGFHSIDSGRNFETHFKRPKCIYRSSDWIGRYSRWNGRRIRTYAKVSIEKPNYILKTKLNSKLRPVSVVEENGLKIYEVEFNPFDAHVNKATNVAITAELDGEIITDEYVKISNNCESLF